MLSRKIKDTKEISLMKTNEIMKARKEAAKVLKSFFWNLIAKIWIFNSEKLIQKKLTLNHIFIYGEK